MGDPRREYDSIVADLSESGSRTARMQTVADALWEAFSSRGYSWVGFYLESPEASDDERLVLGPRRDKPACSPIGLHGACGRAFITKRTLIIHDVKDLGENYIACDPNDQSEIVIPLIDADGQYWGVLDIDSHEVGAFDERDDAGLRAVLLAAGLLDAD